MTKTIAAACFRRSGSWRSQDGGALIETAIALPVLFFLIFCFIEICLAFYAKEMISECAREGTRYAIYHGATCPNSSTPMCQASANQVNSFVTGLGWPNLAGGTMTVDTTYPGGNRNPGSPVRIVVSYTLPIRVPFAPANTLVFTSTSQMNILQ